MANRPFMSVSSDQNFLYSSHQFCKLWLRWQRLFWKAPVHKQKILSLSFTLQRYKSERPQVCWTSNTHTHTWARASLRQLNENHERSGKLIYILSRILGFLGHLRSRRKWKSWRQKIMTSEWPSVLRRKHFVPSGIERTRQREETRNAKRARERKRRCRYFAINSLASRTKIEEITATSFHMVLDFLHAGRE